MSVEPVLADVTDSAELKAAIEALTRVPLFSTINIIVNNAAGPIMGTDRQILWDDARWQSAINVKAVGALRIIRECLPFLATDGTGRILNITGASGIAVSGQALLHGMNNAALMQMTSYMAADLATAKVTVNAIVPGVVGTETRQAWAENMGREKGLPPMEAIADYCRGRGVLSARWAEVREIADLAVFLASDRAQFINGARIPIDGGFSTHTR